jgi:hypothetical protein
MEATTKDLQPPSTPPSIEAARRELRRIDADLVAIEARYVAAMNDTDAPFETRAAELAEIRDARRRREDERVAARERLVLTHDAAFPSRRAFRLEQLDPLTAELRDLDTRWNVSADKVQGLEAEIAKLRAAVLGEHDELNAKISALSADKSRIALSGSATLLIEDLAAVSPWEPPDRPLVKGSDWWQTVTFLQTTAVTDERTGATATVSRALLFVDEDTGRVWRLETNVGLFKRDADAGRFVRIKPKPEPSQSPAIAIETSPDLVRAQPKPQKIDGRWQ